MFGRISKQIVYGLIYAVFWAAIGFGAYYLFFRPAPSCFDHVEDQGEQGIDCGGPCANACIPTALPLVAQGGVSVFHNPEDTVTLLAQIQNPNAAIGASDFGYSFNFYDASGTLLGSLADSSFVYPNEEKYLIAANVPFPPDTAATDLSFATGTAWSAIPPATEPPPALSFASVSVASVSSGTAAIGGIVSSGEPVGLSNILIVAVLKNAAGAVIGASQTEINQIPVGTSANFSVLYPAGLQVSASNTQLFAYAER